MRATAALAKLHIIILRVLETQKLAELEYFALHVLILDSREVYSCSTVEALEQRFNVLSSAWPVVCEKLAQNLLQQPQIAP